MKRKLILLDVAIVALAVGFVLYNSNPNFTEEIKVASGAQYEEAVATGGNTYGVPADILYTEPVETVAFSHEKHAVELKYECSTCHSGIFQMQAKTVQRQVDFNMKGLADGKYCGSCHSAEHEVAFATDDQCARCHIGVTGLEAKVNLETEGAATEIQADSGEAGTRPVTAGLRGDTGNQAGNGWIYK